MNPEDSREHHLSEMTGLGQPVAMYKVEDKSWTLEIVESWNLEKSEIIEKFLNL